MKSNVVIGISLTIVILSLNCSSNTSDSRIEGAVVLNFEILEDAKLSEVFKEVQYSKLDLPDSLYIGVIDKAIFYQGKLFLFDFLKTQTLFIFKENGDFINAIHKPGQGPSEYLRPMDFTVDENEIEILDVTNKIITYNVKGEYLREVKIPFNTNKFSKISKYEYLLYTKGSANTQDGKNTECELMILNTKSSKTTCVLFKDESQFVPQFHQKNIISEGPERTLFSKVFSDTIYSVSSNKVKVEYILEFGSMALDKERIDTRKVSFDYIVEVLNDKSGGAYHNPELYENERILISRYRQGKLNYVVFDRQDSTFKRLRSGAPNNINNGLPFYTMNALWKNQAVAFIDPNLFLDIYYEYLNAPSNEIDPELLSFCKSLDINDPPIMVRYTFK